MVDVIESGEPAIMVCHWPGIYYNGEKLGFNIFKEVVNRLKQKYGANIKWMKLSEISRYWAAKEFVSFEESKNGLTINAPFATKDFTIKIDMKIRNPILHYGSEKVKLTERSPSKSIESNSYSRSKGEIIACFDLPTGKSVLREG